jgi:GTPase SAR1 family protein
MMQLCADKTNGPTPAPEYIPRVFDWTTIRKQSSTTGFQADLQLRDTVGGYIDYMASRMRALSYSQVDVVLLMFNVTDRRGFVELMEHFMAEAARFGGKANFIVVGTHIDARQDQDESVAPPNRHVTTEEARREFEVLRDLVYIETSIATNDNIDEVMDAILEAARRMTLRKPFTASTRDSVFVEKMDIRGNWFSRMFTRRENKITN